MDIVRARLGRMALSCPVKKVGERARMGYLLLVETDDGNWGVGEAAPLSGYSLDTADEVKRSLTQWCAAPQTMPASVAEVATMVARLIGGPSARFALETALLDLLGKRQGVPCWALWGKGKDPQVSVSALVTLPAMDAMVRDAQACGVTAFKCKVGRSDIDDDEEMAALMRLRGLVGDAHEIRLDANGALRVGRVKERLANYREVDPSFVEEPIPMHQWGELGTSPVPLAADESLAISGGRNVLSLDAVRVAVLKPSMLGGVLASFEMARWAQLLGKDVVVTHMFEGSVGFAACCHGALALSQTLHVQQRACGLFPYLSDGRAGVFAEVENGVLAVPREPGLGVSMSAVSAGVVWMN